MGDVIELHPKFVNRWAKVYIDRYVKNKDEAIAWACKMFPENYLDPIVVEAKKELAKRGIKLVT